MDGHISFAEFDDLMYEWKRDRDFPRNLTILSIDLRSLFEKFDLNGDGYLSRGDFMQLIAYSDPSMKHPPSILTCHYITCVQI